VAMRIAGPDIAIMPGYVCMEKADRSAGMLIEAYSRRDLPVGVTIAATGDDHIETDLSQYRGVIPFRDNGPRKTVFSRDLIQT
jgi:hypothetical protein